MSMASDVRETALGILVQRPHIANALAEIRAAAREGKLQATVQVIDRVAERASELLLYLTEEGFTIVHRGMEVRPDVVTTTITVGWSRPS